MYVLDGALATELERNGFSLQGDPLWSARLLHENPEAITEIHKSYLESGADIITTSSYQASVSGFKESLGLNDDEAKNLIKSSVALAKKAVEQYGLHSKGGQRILIAGSVGSYGAALADGSEYTGNFCDSMTQEELIKWHRPRVQSLVDAGADLLAFETIPALKEAEALVKLLKEYSGLKAWLSFSSQSKDKTAHGEDISTAALKCSEMSQNQLIAIGVNCCSPEFAVGLLENINSVLPDFPLIVYPNSGEIWDTNTGWSGGNAKPIKEYLKCFVNSNVKYIGGCCRTTPNDIQDIYELIQKMKA